MVGDIFAGISGANSIIDTLKRFKDMSDANVRNGVAVELQEKILAAYHAQAALAEKVSALEKEVARFETWEAEKDRYQLTDYGGGTFAYQLKKEMSNGEPSHRICPNCYEERKKSILQFEHPTAFKQEHFSCPRCQRSFDFGNRVKPDYPANANRGATWRV